jgi:hypothetical protein
VKERGVCAGDDADLDVAFLQDLIETAITRTSEEALDGVVDVVPTLLQHLVAGLFCGADVERVEIGVADDPNLADRFDLLVHQVEDRRSEVASDPEVF